jgi:tetratricopeptide (TPR) repeat protein
MRVIGFIMVLLTACLACPAALHAQESLDFNAVTMYLKGAYFEARYDLANAYRFYAAADRFDRNNARIHLSLARVSLELGNLEKAQQYAEYLLQRGVYDSKARFILAEVDYRRGDEEATLARLLELLEREDISRFDVLKFLSKVYLDLGQPGEAAKALEEARELFSEDLYVHYRLGFLYSETGEFEKALASFEKVIELNPGLSNAHFARASLLNYLGRMEEAKHSYRVVLDLEPENTNAVKELSEILYAEGEYREGIELLEPLHAGGKLDEIGEISLGKFYYRAGMGEDAVAIFNGLLDKDGENVLLLRIVSEIEVERGHFKTAYGYLKRLIELDQDGFANYVGVLLVSFDLAGEPAAEDEVMEVPQAEREANLETAIQKMDTNSAEDNYLIGAVLRKVGDDGRAEHFLLRAEELEADDRRTLLELASLYERRGQFDRALDRVIRLYRKNPEDASVINFYGYLLAEKGVKLDLAEELLSKALSKEPENGYFLDSMGWIQFRKGDYSEALKILLEAVDKVDNDPVIWEHLGDVYEKLEKADKALDAYQKSLDIDPDRDDVRDKITNIKSLGNNADK